jgi:hypothetical protein
MKWNTPLAWVAVGFVAGAGSYAVVDQGVLRSIVVQETECQRFDRRCAILNTAGTHWIGSALCGLSGLIVHERTEERCAALNVKLDETLTGAEGKEEGLAAPHIQLEDWRGQWSSSSGANITLRLSGALVNPPDSPDGYEDVDCKATVTLEYRDGHPPLKEDSSFLCSSIYGLPKGERAPLNDRLALYFKREVIDYPLERATMSFSLTSSNPFGTRFKKEVPAFEIPLPTSEERFSIALE